MINAVSEAKAGEIGEDEAAEKVAAELTDYGFDAGTVAAAKNAVENRAFGTLASVLGESGVSIAASLEGSTPVAPVAPGEFAEGSSSGGEDEDEEGDDEEKEEFEHGGPHDGDKDEEDDEEVPTEEKS